MPKTKSRFLIFPLLVLLLLGGCKRLFETASDVQARSALQDLMRIQEDYHKKNNRYARNLIEVGEAGFKLDYHTGIVYVEIEQADADTWRAVALPAESATARVFAYDSLKGGFYEMDDKEVASYVLGALNFIRHRQSGQRTLDGLALGIILVLGGFGLRTWLRHRVPGAGWLAAPFLLCIPPLALSALSLVHMEPDIVLSGWLRGLLIGNCVLAALCVGGTWMGFKKIQRGEALTSLSALAVCTVLISLFNVLVATHTFINFSANPDPLGKYIRPEGLSPRAGFGAR